MESLLSNINNRCASEDTQYTKDVDGKRLKYRKYDDSLLDLSTKLYDKIRHQQIAIF